jgi:hypothetical protein
MARRTRPVARQVIEPRLESVARLKGRLIDFDTDSAVLEAQHHDWLTAQMRIAMTRSP